MNDDGFQAEVFQELQVLTLSLSLHSSFCVSWLVFLVISGTHAHAAWQVGDVLTLGGVATGKQLLIESIADSHS